MKRLIKKTKGVVKGIPSAVLLSAGIHILLLFVAGGLVVFTALNKVEKKFVPPPPVARPKMDLKKPQVKVRKTSAPPAARHIVSKSVQVMTDLQLPDVSGISGSGLGGGLGGIDLMPDVSDLSVFGGTKSVAVGNDFEGTFYALNMTRDGTFEETDFATYYDIIKRFLDHDWSPNVFAPFYRAPKKLYTTQFMIPWTDSGLGPSSFGLGWETLFDPYRWLVHYKGKIKSKKGGTYRFWSAADDTLFVRVNRKLVLNGTWGEFQKDVYDWNPESEEHLQHYMSHIEASVGNWFTLEAGQVVDMELLMGEVNGGQTSCILLIEDKAESAYYSRRASDDMPILPVFRTAEMSERIKTEIKYATPKDEVDLEGGEIFNVY
jgi:hypothetical protein